MSQGQLFDPAGVGFDPPDVVAVCHRCGARSEPIPAATRPGDDRWWEGVAWALVALGAHEKDCPGRA